MGRLVDVDEVIKAVDKHTKDEAEIVLDNDITCILEEVPTAYNVEKVAADLQKASMIIDSNENSVKCAIEENMAVYIVRKGGVE